MTDRINRIAVVLDREYRDDDVQSIVEAIKMIKGVLTVGTHVADHTDYMAIERAKADLGSKLFDVIYGKKTS